MIKLAYVHPTSLTAKAERVLAHLDRSKEWIIYPFGEKGKLVKGIIDVYYGGAIVADNLIKNVKDVISLNELRNSNLKDYLVLLCSDSEKYYNELREHVFEFIPFDQVVDVFSNSMFYDKGIYYSSVHYTDDRISALELVAREIYRNDVAGDTAECGVYRGEFSKYIARLLPDRKLHLFDTFDGFDKRDTTNSENDNFFFNEIDMFNNTSVEIVRKNIGYYVDVVVRKGWFPDTVNGLQENKYAFVSLDTDLYDPIFSGLEYFWPRLSPGGYIFVHDYGLLHGVNKAVEKFCKENHISYVRLPDYSTSAIIQKPLSR